MIGQHLLADLYDVASDRLANAGLLADCLDDAARRGGMKPIGPPVLHRFEGGGLTGYLLLSESHIAFHTYPEHRYIALDIFSCGGADSKAALSSGAAFSLAWRGKFASFDEAHAPRHATHYIGKPSALIELIHQRRQPPRSSAP